MRFRHPVWIPICWLGSVANVIAVWFAARPAQTWHATAHGAFAVVFAVAAERLRARRDAA